MLRALLHDADWLKDRLDAALKRDNDDLTNEWAAGWAEEFGPALIAELRTSRKVVEAAEWYQQCRDNVERRVRVTGMDEAREGLRSALREFQLLNARGSSDSGE